MSKLKNEVLNYFDKCVARSNKIEEKLLKKQKREGIRECRRIQGLLKRKSLLFRNELRNIEEKMIPYIKRNKWMPWSYTHMLRAWEERYYDVGGRR